VVKLQNMKKLSRKSKARKRYVPLAVRKALSPPAPTEPSLLKLNLGAGKSRIEGYLSVDSIPFEGLDVVADLKNRWPWGENSVSHIHMSHALEHFTGEERVHIFNEMYRVLAPGGQAYLIVPHWASQRAYGDFTHKWPPVSEMLFNYLWKEWRMQNAPHNDIQFNPQGYNCDFSFGGGYGLHEEVLKWNDDRSQYAQKWFRDACADIHMTITSLKKLPE
jgi:SAM-dependent methyltransferase